MKIIFNNKKLTITAIAIATVFLYLYLTNFQLIKSLVGYNVPKLKNITEDIDNGQLDFLEITNGFEISIFAKDLIKPRVIAFDPNGKMLVSETQEGRVLLLEDKDKDGFTEERRIIIDNLNLPHGLAFYIDPQSNITYLYIAETHRVARYIYNVDTAELESIVGENIANLPEGGRHFTRTIDFGPNYRTQPIIGGFVGKETISDDKLYISVGSSCDTCIEEATWKRAAILESDPQGSFTAKFAFGLRNSVFFTFHPQTGELWATEMGRDNLGDDLPPDEINIIKLAGTKDEAKAESYGWPFCYGNQVRDETFNPKEVKRTDIPQDCMQTAAPVINLQAHVAPLGLAFISNNSWSAKWQNNLLVAEHGSWNRSVPVGYRVVRFDVDAQGKVLGGPYDFITGWLDGKNIFGRPVDLKFGPDNMLYISDDAAGVIYRVKYGI